RIVLDDTKSLKALATVKLEPNSRMLSDISTKQIDFRLSCAPSNDVPLGWIISLQNDLECHLFQKGLETTGGASANLSVLSTITSILGYNLYCAKTRMFCAGSSMYKDKLENTAFGPKLVATTEDDKPVARYGLLVKKERMEIKSWLVLKSESGR
ncbi:hypothetical protein Tco_1545206, partial [Tanacetum coccineum]